MRLAVADQIKVTVNGKVDALKTELQGYVIADTAWKEVDKKWKEDAQPSINLGKNLKWGGMFIASVVAVGAGLTGIIVGFIEIIKAIKK